MYLYMYTYNENTLLILHLVVAFSEMEFKLFEYLKSEEQ